MLEDKNVSQKVDDFYVFYDIEDRLKDMRKQFSGRDVAVNCVLGVIEMSSKVKDNIEIKDTNAVVAPTMVNSSTLATWAITQGANDGLSLITVSSLIKKGLAVSFEKAQKGDILVSPSHLLMIVENKPRLQKFLVVENDENNEVVIKSKSYASLSGNYQARDLSSIYNN